METLAANENTKMNGFGLPEKKKLGVPSSYNMQPWRFVVVRDPEQRKRLRMAAMNQAQVEQAPVVIVACGDFSGWKEDLEEAGARETNSSETGRHGSHRMEYLWHGFNQPTKPMSLKSFQL
jgi:nitroreductase